ncbi:MAG: WYL domain-containing protein [Actinomycetota bacterium]
MQKVIERILNLLAFLLTVDRPVGADEIRHTVAGYDRDNDTAFHRTFERDKALLRRLGIPIEREATDVFEVEFGYVVDDDAYALDDPGLSDDERAALSLAVQAVGFGGRPSGHEALLKLGGAVGSLEGTQLGADLGQQADALATAFEAVSERRILSLDYRGRERRLEPYGLVHRRGHWYVVGPEAGERRAKVYRLDRASALLAGEHTDAFTPPEGFDPGKAVLDRPWDAGDEPVTALVVFDEEIAWIAERDLGSRAETTTLPDGSLEARVPVSAEDAFVGWMIGFEEKAEIVEPPDLRERLIDLVGHV